MKTSPHFSEANRAHTPSTGSRSILRTLLMTTALGVGCGNATQQMEPNTPVSPVASSGRSHRSANTEFTAEPQSANGLLFEPGTETDPNTFPITVQGDYTVKPMGWPGVPANCYYTGVVLGQERHSEPHRILLENMCLQKRDGVKNIFEGDHLLVEADARGCYDIPFVDAHLEERGSSIVFVTEADGHQVEEPLRPGKYQTNTLSFERQLDTYHIQSRPTK